MSDCYYGFYQVYLNKILAFVFNIGYNKMLLKIFLEKLNQLLITRL